MGVALIVLAAGQGSRMNSELPKVLHPLAGAPLLAHGLRAGAALDPARIVVVTGHGAAAVEAATAQLAPEAICVRQTEQLGTGHAVAQTAQALAGFGGDALVLYGDTPFISPETLLAMQAARAAGADMVVLGFEAADPGRYGRLVTDGDALLRIVEAKDATPDELALDLCNSGVMMADAQVLLRLVAGLSNDNASREYYLTDTIAAGRAEGLRARVVVCPEAETLGINTRAELAAAEQAFQARARARALEDGVTLADPATTYFAFDTVIGRDATIGPQVVFGPGVTVESGAEIRAFSHLEGCHVSRGARVGPFARLRPGAELAENTHVGNFVEIKNATLAQGAKVNHLSYIGDAAIGEASNVGAGTITCNYDGVFKHRTEIGARSFIGSNTCLVAPVRVGDEAMTATGTVVTQDIPDGAMAVGRTRQENKPGFARRFMTMLRARKSAKGAH
ncbi:bifunctional UDP-N-acetylglucosamine diphosphorylase/glucosamine-1-phosphate N-acetyltransferase GlmU [Dinoroseobacter sp. PD6]|uniref:bifunctional UDP-N-acetylglucosamine diphosphorylase/glucosamine-1-phosphate N-acetyltransferase GlmU n=1 Tax=Dinoroseobacter sp. PD6 TaxID=3028384 RepID=UPI00237A8F9B|nr:bifunctional UDP-N-acetylglucosamine diphosphorylase/glucosamine-1-phosphate N-acetyltransferase GlmU [Dinoroseobacter sp. PD6]MDD9716137.1 bifunctional UDP-N-acetylglucosamine diphosphorylase/glucosamine-1-phosphate N-acetyltransferase GlmU [Dinoroseobacter sp. PD6]